ncbi:MAG: hypothetical protein IH598_15925 [Bacteroidales bacterium]|nr:hypothetical protein [Bacteroidales bacterium]
MKQFHHFFGKDSYLFGVALGLITPALLYPLFQWLLEVIPFISGTFGQPGHKLMLLSLAGNLLWLRYYLVGVKQEKSGIAILVVTFLLVLVFFIFYN